MTGKRALNASNSRSSKRDPKSITLDVKLNVLRWFEADEKLSHILKSLGLAASTLRTMRDNKDKIKASSQAATPVSATRLTCCRSDIMGNMERLKYLDLRPDYVICL